MLTDITDINERFIKLHCIGCPYAEQERITEGLPGCYCQSNKDVIEDLNSPRGCNSRWVREYKWGKD
jgi:hypothetical protein